MHVAEGNIEKFHRDKTIVDNGFSRGELFLMLFLTICNISFIILNAISITKHKDLRLLTFDKSLSYYISHIDALKTL